MFLGKFEKLDVYPCVWDALTFYCQFMDNVFLWHRTESEQIEFVGNLNKEHPTTKSWIHIFQNQYHFLGYEILQKLKFKIIYHYLQKIRWSSQLLTL